MSESLRGKLRRLRREAPAEPAAVVPAEQAAEQVADTTDERPRSSVRARLAARAGRASARVPASPREALPSPTCRTTSGPPADLVARGADERTVHARTSVSAAGDAHGAFALDEVRAVDAATFELLTGDPALAGLDLADVVYLDTETTGLSGGAGTWVFLVGLGRFTDDGSRFEVWQGFLNEPEGEEALLAECAERIRDASAVVSFFGKSFDRHRLEDKMRLCGVAPPFEERPHLDLFHPLRRLYRGAFADARLATMERELCGFRRADDLPGAFAPAAWFDYLAGRPHRLEGVFEHNLHDVRSLVSLAAHLGRALAETRADGTALEGPAPERAAGLARSLWERGRRDEALAWLVRARERRDTRELRLLHADALRRTRATGAARTAYAGLVEEPEDAATARCWVELAKLHEHGGGDAAEALECCRRARAAAERRLIAGARARLLRDLDARERRLAAKLEA